MIVLCRFTFSFMNIIQYFLFKQAILKFAKINSDIDWRQSATMHSTQLCKAVNCCRWKILILLTFQPTLSQETLHSFVWILK